MRQFRLLAQGAAIISRESTGSKWNRISAFRANSLSPQQSAPLPRTPRRFDSSKPSAAAKATLPKPAPHRNPDEPIYQLTFTCKACKTRSSHTVSKQGYHHGTVLITCSGCKARHLISDHLRIFSDKSITLEDILQQKGQSLQRGTVDTEGDVEFWPENTEPVEKKQEPPPPQLP